MRAGIVLIALALAGCTCEPEPPAPKPKPKPSSERAASSGAGGERADAPEIWAGLRVHRIGEARGDGPVVVLLHGYGAPGDDLVRFAEAIDAPEGTRFVLPEAPDPQPRRRPKGGAGALPSGRMWWPIDLAKVRRMQARGETRDLSEQVPDGMPAARERVLRLLAETERRLDVGSERIVLGGFSQGAMLTVDVAAHHPDPLGGLVVMSGTLASDKAWREGLAEHAGTPVLLSHGRSDPLLPFTMAERLRAVMREAGLEVEWMPFDGGHTIPPDVRDRAGELLHELDGG